MKRGESMGPRVENTVEELLAEVYGTPLGPISAAHIVLGIKAAYTRRARLQLGLDALEIQDLEKRTPRPTRG